MQPPFPSPVPTWHNKEYPAISPSQAHLSSAGKTVVITGAGTGIGQETAVAFATAGAKHIILIGRTEDTLAQTKDRVSKQSGSGVTCTIFRADVTDSEAMARIAADVGTWDVFILNAGYTSTPGNIASCNLDDYWKTYEINVKSVIISAKAFLPSANKAHATMLGVTSGAQAFPTAHLPGLSAYMTSKVAQVKMLEFLAAENPNLFVASVHPGMVDTSVFRKSGATPDMVPIDSAKLPGHFMSWLSSPEAAFLKGKLVWANWDVEELKVASAKIQEGSLLTVGMQGWPYTSLV